jgi:hypothetical protein
MSGLLKLRGHLWLPKTAIVLLEPERNCSVTGGKNETTEQCKQQKHLWYFQGLYFRRFSNRIN